MLYSVVPRSSQCPSISTGVAGFVLSHSAFAARVFASSDRMSYWSKSKKIGFTAAFSVNSFGPGRAAADTVGSGGGGDAAAMGCGVVGGSESAGSSVGPGEDDGGCGAAAATDAAGAAATGVDGRTRISATLTSGSAPRTRPTMWSPSTLK